MRRIPTKPKQVPQHLRKIAPPVGHVDAVFQEAIALHEKGQLRKAAVIYERILSSNPRHSEALHLLGVVAYQLGNHALAIELISQSIDINPTLAGAHSNLGNVLKDVNRLDEALASYDTAIALKADYAGAHYNRGLALKRLKRLDEAIASYDRAIALRADYAEAYNNRGNALRDLNRLEEALDSYDRAIALRVDDSEAHNNRGLVLKDLMRLEEALLSHDRAIVLKQEFADAHLNKSLLILLRGDLISGWTLYEWRWKKRGIEPFRREFPEPLWVGDEPLTGRTILLHAEQGLGDTIQFCRYAQLVKQLGARVILEAPEALVDLLGSVNGIDALIKKGDPLPAFDFHCPLLSLPLAFKTDLQSIPCDVPYLKSSEEFRGLWAERLGPKRRARVGLTWSGNKNYTGDRNRSMALAELLPWLPDNCEYYCLQKDVRDSDMELLLRSEIKFYGDELTFPQAAALIDLMDVVVSTDTSIPHLAAALGKPTWLMLPFVPDWRWMLDREESPWYPSIRLYRQAEDRRWAGVLSRISAELKLLACRLQPQPG